jgi:hypothetical protein
MQRHVANSLLKEQFGGKDTHALYSCGGVLSLVLRQGIPLSWYWKQSQLVLEVGTGSSHSGYWKLVLEVVTVGTGSRYWKYSWYWK